MGESVVWKNPIEDLDDAQAGVPRHIRQELLDCAVTNGRISYHWLCRLYKRGVADGQAAMKQPESAVPPRQEPPKLNRKAFQKRVRERVAAGLPEDDEGDDFQPWVWKILFEECEAAVAAVLPPVPPRGQEPEDDQSRVDKGIGSPSTGSTNGQTVSK